MKALSIMQPWASLIVGGPLAAGVKRTENRGRAVAMYARKLVGQRIAIHASKKLDIEAFEDIWHRSFGFGFDAKTECPYATMGEFPLGAVIGVATLDRVFGPGDLISEDEDRFYIGSDPLRRDDAFGLSFGQRRWIEPVPVSGALGFWTLPDDVEAKVREQLERSAA